MKTALLFFDDLLFSKQASNIDLFFTIGNHNTFYINYTSRSYFHWAKNTFRKSFNINILFKQTLIGIILKFHKIAGLD